MVVNCDSLEQVREKIDGLDRQIVGLIAERGAYVSQAARFKKGGLSKPNCSRIRATFSSEACSPNIATAGSPGIRRWNRKMINVTPIKVGITVMSLLSMYLPKVTSLLRY